VALRTTRTTATFLAPFVLPELDEPQPAGTYRIETDEEIFEGNGRTVYVRVATLLYLESGGTTSIVTVDPQELEAALANDARIAAPDL
jgi:hypothetical protein